MEISVNRTTRTIDIMVPRDQVPDGLLRVLPEATSQFEGCLAWSIRFGDVTRTPRNSAGVAEDELLGSVGAIVGAISSQGRSSGLRPRTPNIIINNALAEDSIFIAPLLIFTEPLRATFRASESEPLAAIRRLQEEFVAELATVRGTRNSEGSIGDLTNLTPPAFSTDTLGFQIQDLMSQ
jgi:hypothetical protein